MLRIYYFTLYLPHSDQELHVTIKEHIFKVKSLLNNSLCQFKADLILKIRCGDNKLFHNQKSTEKIPNRRRANTDL